MNEKNLCAAVNDLLPLYIDGVLSDGTEALIEEHLKNCASCRAYYQELTLENQSGNMTDSGKKMEKSNDRQTERTLYRRIAGKIKRRRVFLFCGAAAALLLVFVISASMLEYAVVSGKCMEPAIRDGEKYVLNKWSYRIGSPKRGDIIIYERDGIYYITRIAGLPGEKAGVREGRLYIDGQAVQVSADYPKSLNLEERILDTDEYLALPDHISPTEHRDYFIKNNDIAGKVIITR